MLTKLQTSGPDVNPQKMCEIVNMILSRTERDFDFGGAEFDLQNTKDRFFLGWVFNQFLYGEVTGIQCGYWLYRAPSLLAAQFLARQAAEELAHVKKMVRILELLRVAPGRAHFLVRFMSTGMMGGTWGEHVAIEMALGEGLVLNVFYALARTLPRGSEIGRLVEQAIEDEEKHVEFGERETREWLRRFPCHRNLFAGLALVQILSLRFLERFISSRLLGREGLEKHAVLVQFGAFARFTASCQERQALGLGIFKKTVLEMGFFEKLVLVLGIPVRQLRLKLKKREGLLTEVYLLDPSIRQKLE